MSLYNGRETSKEDYPPGTRVHTTACTAQSDDEHIEGVVLQPPTRQCRKYSIRVNNSTTIVEADPEEVWGENETRSNRETTHETTEKLDPIVPSWLREGTPISLYVDDHYEQGELSKDVEGDWQFVGKDTQPNNQRTIVELPDLDGTYRQRQIEKHPDPRMAAQSRKTTHRERSFCISWRT